MDKESNKQVQETKVDQIESKIDDLIKIIKTQQEYLEINNKSLQTLSAQLTGIYQLMELGCKNV